MTQTTGVKFRSESEVTGWYSATQGAGMDSCTLQNATPAHRISWVKIENFDQERYFASVLYANGLPLEFFTDFGRPTAENYNRSFWPKWCFWPACNQNLGSVLLRCDHRSNSQNFDLERLRTFAPMISKVTLQDFLPILGTLRPNFGKIWKFDFGRTLVKKTESKPQKYRTQVLVTRRSKRPIRNFRPWGPQNGYKILEGDHWHKGPKRNTLSRSKFSILTHLVRCAGVALYTLQSAIPALWLQSATLALRIRFGTLRQWCDKFPPGFFTHFGRPTAENYESFFLTVVKPNGAFDQRATKTWVRSFWGATLSHIFEILTSRGFGRLRQWSRKFPSKIFYPFLTRHGRKLLIGLFNRCATRKGLKIPRLMASYPRRYQGTK